MTIARDYKTNIGMIHRMQKYRHDAGCIYIIELQNMLVASKLHNTSLLIQFLKLTKTRPSLEILNRPSASVVCRYLSQYRNQCQQDYKVHTKV